MFNATRIRVDAEGTCSIESFTRMGGQLTRDEMKTMVGGRALRLPIPHVTSQIMLVKDGHIAGKYNHIATSIAQQPVGGDALVINLADAPDEGDEDDEDEDEEEKEGDTERVEEETLAVA